MKKNLIFCSSKPLLIKVQRGFSLVEIMVGLAIGLLGVLVIMQISMVFEGQKRTTTAGADAQTSGAVAFYSVEQDVRRAGYGFSKPEILGCQLKFHVPTASDAVPPPGVAPPPVLQPLFIFKGGEGGSDSIQVLSSSKGNWSVPVRMGDEHSSTATEVQVSSTLGVQAGDLLIAYETGKTCAMFQATGPVAEKSNAISDPIHIEHKSASNGIGAWNPEDPSEIFPTEGYGKAAYAYVFNLGNLVNRKYQVDVGGNLTLVDGGVERVVASDIVSMRAQYGIIDTIDAEKKLTWKDGSSDGKLDADDLAGLYAARVVMVVRSPLKERPNAEGNCEATKSSDMGTWAEIDVKNNTDWQCYRYRTFENVIPLRNMMWREEKID